MKQFYLLLFLIVSVFAQDEDAETTEETSSSNTPFWEAVLSGGEYMVKVDEITSISHHAYLLDGAVVVTEMTIDTKGQSVVRFYQMTPVTEYSKLNITGDLSDKVRELSALQSEYTGVDQIEMVQKQYPITTHARTVEYQIDSLAKLKRLYNSAKRALEDGAGRKITVK